MIKETELTCEVCKKHFFRQICKIKERQTKFYCSLKCLKNRQIQLECCVCGESFFRSKSETERNEKRRSKIFCSRECSGKLLISNFNGKRYIGWEQLVPNNRHDEFSPFRNHLKNIQHACKDRKKPEWVQITLEDLKEQWDKQSGVCPYTGWELLNPHSSAVKLSRTPNRASVDRIDSSKGYTKKNIQFICLVAQYAKNGWSEEVLTEFAEAIMNHRQKSNLQNQKCVV